MKYLLLVLFGSLLCAALEQGEFQPVATPRPHHKQHHSSPHGPPHHGGIPPPPHFPRPPYGDSAEMKYISRPRPSPSPSGPPSDAPPPTTAPPASEVSPSEP